MSEIVGIGVDLEPIESFTKRPFRKYESFYRRLFSKEEILYCRKFKESGSRFATRYCAKEAFVKAARGIFSAQVTDIEIKMMKDGAPTIKPRKKKGRLQNFFRKHHIFVSLTHTSGHAMAFVIVNKK